MVVRNRIQTTFLTQSYADEWNIHPSHQSTDDLFMHPPNNSFSGNFTPLMAQKELGSLFVNWFRSMPALQHTGEISVRSVLVFLPTSSVEGKQCWNSLLFIGLWPFSRGCLSYRQDVTFRAKQKRWVCNISHMLEEGQVGLEKLLKRIKTV